MTDPRGFDPSTVDERLVTDPLGVDPPTVDERSVNGNPLLSEQLLSDPAPDARDRLVTVVNRYHKISAMYLNLTYILI